MQEHIGAINWFHVFRVMSAFVLTAAMGIHSFCRHTQESVKVVSARKLMYWLYSVIFLAASIANFVLLVLTLEAGNYVDAPSTIWFFTLPLVISYIALLIGARKNPYK